MELLSYAAIDPNFELDVVDFSDPSSAAFLGSLDSATRRLCSEWNNAVIVACQRRAGFYPEAEHDPYHPARRVQFLVAPFEITKIESARILDLREKPAMEAFAAVGAFSKRGLRREVPARRVVWTRPAVGRGIVGRVNSLIRSRPNVHDVGLRGLPKHDDPLRDFLYYALNRRMGDLRLST